MLHAICLCSTEPSISASVDRLLPWTLSLDRTSRQSSDPYQEQAYGLSPGEAMLQHQLPWPVAGSAMVFGQVLTLDQKTHDIQIDHDGHSLDCREIG